MTSLMQIALGNDWQELPVALQKHYSPGTSVDCGHMDIDYPGWMQPILSLLRLLGALVDSRGKQVTTVVEKRIVGQRQYWHRKLTYTDGTTLRFDSHWVLATGGEVIEFVNPVLGLRMKPFVKENRLHYHGVCFVLKFGPIQIPIPEWLALGHTVIIEEAIDDRHFAMDFRLIHPLFGQVFRYAGRFESACSLRT